MDEDVSALQRVREGDEEALRELMSRHREAVFRLAVRYLHDAHAATEVTAETFVRVYFRADRYQPRRAVRSWIFTITANLCRDALRRRQREHTIAMPDDDVIPVEALPHETTPHAREQLEQDETVFHLRKAIAALPHRLKFPLIFCILEGHDHDACAEVMGISRKAVETRIYRARKKLRAAMDWWQKNP